MRAFLWREMPWERAELYKTQLQVERALDQPDPGDDGDRSRANEKHQAAIDPGTAQRESERQESGDDRKLAGFHAQVEATQGNQQTALRQSQTHKHTGHT